MIGSPACASENLAMASRPATNSNKNSLSRSPIDAMQKLLSLEKNPWTHGGSHWPAPYHVDEPTVRRLT